jgi:hypothetical protein
MIVVTAWWRRSGWRTIAVVAVPLAGIFGVIAMHRSVFCPLAVEWGSVAELLTGVGTVALFGALLFAALEWRAGQAERRDEKADQARVVIAEPTKKIENERNAVVRNYSSAPIFNLVVENDRRTFIVGDRTLRTNYGPADPILVTVLEPGESTVPFRIQGPEPPSFPPPIGSVILTFTDAHGRRWRKTGNGQPERVVVMPSRIRIAPE